MTCCKNLQNNTLNTLPFNRTIVTDYFDGPISGIAECTICGSSFYFRTLDVNYENDYRVVEFFPIPITFKVVLKLLKCQKRGFSKIYFDPTMNPEDEELIGQYIRDSINSSVSRISIIRNWPGRTTAWFPIDNTNRPSMDEWLSNYKRR